MGTGFLMALVTTAGTSFGARTNPCSCDGRGNDTGAVEAHDGL